MRYRIVWLDFQRNENWHDAYGEEERDACLIALLLYGFSGIESYTIQ